MTLTDIYALTVLALGASGVVAGVFGQADSLVMLSALLLGFGMGLLAGRGMGR